MEIKTENMKCPLHSGIQKNGNFEENHRILIIDDNPEIHEDFRMILGNNNIHSKGLNETKAAIFGELETTVSQKSFELDSAYQGREGVEKVRQAIKAQRPYAMAIVDSRIPPGQDGIETVKQIWKEQPDIQIVICTAYSDYTWEEIIEQLRQTDQLLILKKPFDNIEVYQLASALTKKWVLAQQAQLKQKELEHIVAMRTSELSIANSELREALIEAKNSSKAKSQFLANMSHEIRTPMNGIVGFSELLANEKLTDQQKEFAGYIKDCSQNLLEIISDIFDFSNIETGKMKIETTEYSLAELFASIESLMRPAATKKGLQFEIIQNNDLPAKIKTDPVRLRQCLINLISNAVKFTEKGFVHVTVSLLHINNEPCVSFDVEDTGIGIPPENQQMIFDSFTQVDGQNTRRYQGTGLGLAITKRLIKLLGGQLALTSKVEEGSLFSLVVPAGLDVQSQPMLDHNSYLTQPFDNEKLLRTIPKYKMVDKNNLDKKIDSMKSEIDQLTQLCTKQTVIPEEQQSSKANNTQIDWDSLMKICNNSEELAKKLLSVFFSDNKARVDVIASAIKSAKTEDIKLNAHALKGAASAIAANSLSDTAGKLERAAAENSREFIDQIFENLKTEFNQLHTFVLQQNWIEIESQENSEGDGNV